MHLGDLYRRHSFQEEDTICDLLDDFARALYEKDAAGAIAPLADDAVAFDLAPPLKQDPDVMHDSARLEEIWQPPNSDNRSLDTA